MNLKRFLVLLCSAFIALAAVAKTPDNKEIFAVINDSNSEFYYPNLMMRYKAGESYGIPYRSLIPVSFKNALVAGRCMGTDRQIEASIRVMPGCFITGQAAGTAAALAADTGDVRSVSARSLHKALLDSGAYLCKELR